MSTSVMPGCTEKEEKVSTAEENSPAAELPPDLTVKHPLQNMWTLWFYKNDRSKTWTENLMEIASFNTVEDFWALFNHIESVSRLPSGCDYAVFKHEIKPMWEDERNKQGGRWLLNLDIHQRGPNLDNYWLNLLLCMIGEDFDEYNEDICGAVVQVRPRIDKVSLWTANVKHADVVMKIGKIMRDRLKIPPKNFINYEAHADTQTKSGSTAKCKFQI